MVTQKPDLGLWLASAFNRHFPEVAALPWPEPDLIEAPVDLELDPLTGVRVRAADIAIEISGPLDRRLNTVASFPGNGFQLSNVYTPCATGMLQIAGRRISGSPRVITKAPASSTAFLADAETWCDPEPSAES
ncbi:hypothetical protein OG992_31810 [Micromonospora sp. NBC_00362]|uniref:hypothetical protein n=1 Tax=Micromonospora sp. NBC_00362 TaxID=2975975 RepID=UPI0022523249|nr:hypothetical protein [Micromonospora sp. NBC_00362]MCX5121762.1 hypothetical protein [Micromonospora sp. NBC_00362]